jgi:hypothetical protein
VRQAALIVAIAACGRVSFDGRSDASQADAVTGAFGAPSVVSAVSDPLTDDDPTATGDALELFWASERGGATTGYADIYTVMRASLDAPWSTPAPVTALNSTSEDQSPGITASNTTIVFYRHNSTTDTALMIATRSSPAVAWGTPVAILELDTPVLEKSPFLTSDGLTIYYSSTDGMTTSDLYVATRTSTSEPFAAGVPMSELETATNDDDPWLSSDGHVMYFASDRSGNFEIYEARR